MRAWHHRKRREQVPRFGLCCVQFDSLLKLCSPESDCTQGTQNSWGDSSEKPVWPGWQQITCTGQGHVNRYKQHNTSLFKLKIKGGRANRKQQGTIRHKMGYRKYLGKVAKENLEYLWGSTGWKQVKMETSQGKMELGLQLWQLGSYFFKVKIAQSKQSVLSEKQKH